MRCPAMRWLAVAALVAALVPAQEPLDEGAFRIEVGGRAVGRETFRLERTETGRRLTGRVRLALDERATRLEYELTVGFEEPWLERFEVEASSEDGAPDRVAVEVVGDACLLESGTASVAVADWPGRAVLLDNTALAPFALLLEAHDPAGPAEQDVAAVVPQLAGGLSLVVERRPLEGGLVSWFVVAGDRGFRLVTDEGGRLLSIENPAAALVAWREGDGETRPSAADRPAPDVRSTPVTLKGAGGTPLAGTLHGPARSSRGRAAGVLLLSDAGPDDRHGNPAGSGLRWNHLTALATALAGGGFVVLTLDDRGVGGSEGDVERDRLSERADDAMAALAWLGRQSAVDRRRLAAIGHGEGGLVALDAAGRRDGPDAIVLLATSVRPAADVLIEREVATLAAGGAGDRDLARYRTGRRQALEAIAASSGERLEVDDGRTIEVAALRERLRFDARARLAALERPILYLTGAADEETAGDAALVRQILSRAGHRDHLARSIDGLDRLLMVRRFGPADLCDPDRRLAPEAVLLVETFLRAQVGR